MAYEERLDLSDEMLVLLSGKRSGRFMGRPLRDDVVAALASEHLYLEPRNADAELVVERLIEPLEEVLAEGPPPVLEDRGRRVADAALVDLSIGELHRTAIGFGWGRYEVGPVAVADLTEEIRHVISHRLGLAVTDLLRRWQKAGHLELSQRQRERRRDRYR